MPRIDIVSVQQGEHRIIISRLALSLVALLHNLPGLPGLPSSEFSNLPYLISPKTDGENTKDAFARKSINQRLPHLLPFEQFDSAAASWLYPSFSCSLCTLCSLSSSPIQSDFVIWFRQPSRFPVSCDLTCSAHFLQVPRIFSNLIFTPATASATTAAAAVSQSAVFGGLYQWI